MDLEEEEEEEESKGLDFVDLGGSHGDFGGVGKESRMRGNKSLGVKILRLLSEDIASICPHKILVRILRGHFLAMSSRDVLVKLRNSSSVSMMFLALFFLALDLCSMVN